MKRLQCSIINFGFSLNFDNQRLVNWYEQSLIIKGRDLSIKQRWIFIGIKSPTHLKQYNFILKWLRWIDSLKEYGNNRK